jgi:hypothetical protein
MNTTLSLSSSLAFFLSLSILSALPRTLIDLFLHFLAPSFAFSFRLFLSVTASALNSVTPQTTPQLKLTGSHSMQQSDPDLNKWSCQMDLCQLFKVKRNNDKPALQRTVAPEKYSLIY